MAGSAAFILTSDVINRASTFCVYALIARFRGPVEVGQLALALTLFYAFQVIATAGLKTIVTREVAKDSARVGHYLGLGSVLVIAASVISLVLLAAFVRLMGYVPDTAAIALLVGVGLLPFALSAICEAIFQASGKSSYLALAQVPFNIVKVGLAWLLLSDGNGIRQVVLLLIACHAAIAAVEWWLMLRHVVRSPLPIAPWRVRQLPAVAGSAFGMARSAATFLAIDGLIALNASLNVLLLSALTAEREVGLYSVASQLMIPVMLVYQSAVFGIFPAICRRADVSVPDALNVLERVGALLVALAVPSAVGLYFLADAALLFLYGNADFLVASTALRIMVWNIVPAALTAVFGQIFLASVREKVTLRIVAVDAVVGLIAGVVLIGQFGLIGAAVAAVLTKIVDFFQHYIPVSRLAPAAMRLHALCWKPAVAGTCMALYLAAAPSHGFVLTALAAGAVYASSLSALMLWSGMPLDLLTVRSADAQK
jgi:O-antigen/teichoic acid export membrane protein